MTNGTSVTVTTPAPRGLTPEQQEQYCTLFPSACGRPHGTNTATESAGNNGFTLGIRAPGQSFNDCMKANASNYSLLGIADFALDANGKIADNFWLGFTPASNTVSNLYNAVTGSLTSLVQAGQMAVRTGMGTTLTYGRRTSSIMSLILISFQTKIGLEGKVADVGFEGGLYKDVKTKETGMAISAGIFLIGGQISRTLSPGTSGADASRPQFSMSTLGGLLGCNFTTSTTTSNFSLGLAAGVGGEISFDFTKLAELASIPCKKVR